MKAAVVLNRLIAEFDRKNNHRNPYHIGAKAFHDWYSTHSKYCPIPGDMLPKQADYDAWDQEKEDYIVAGLLRKCGYAAVREAYPIIELGSVELCQGDGQCTFDCELYGTDKCVFRN